MKRKRMARGERRAQAVKVIRSFEDAHRAWSVPDLARAMGVQPAQAYLLVDAMHRAGELEHGARRCIVEGPVLSRNARTA